MGHQEGRSGKGKHEAPEKGESIVGSTKWAGRWQLARGAWDTRDGVIASSEH